MEDGLHPERLFLASVQQFLLAPFHDLQQGAQGRAVLQAVGHDGPKGIVGQGVAILQAGLDAPFLHVVSVYGSIAAVIDRPESHDFTGSGVPGGRADR
mgnify:CR=1 FL=1